MSRLFGLFFGVATHVLFALSVWHLFWFLKGPLPEEVRISPVGLGAALGIDTLLALVFAVPHSVFLMPSVTRRLASSMLGASAPFRDTLAGRKRTVRLLPVLHRKLPAFGIGFPERRLLHGGLPGHRPPFSQRHHTRPIRSAAFSQTVHAPTIRKPSDETHSRASHHRDGTSRGSTSR